MKNRKTSPRSAVVHNPPVTLAVVYNLLPLGDLGAETSRRFSALRQIRHAGTLGTVFPQERETAVLDLPEADQAKGVGSRKFERGCTEMPCEARWRVIRRQVVCVPDRLCAAVDLRSSGISSLGTSTKNGKTSCGVFGLSSLRTLVTTCFITLVTTCLMSLVTVCLMALDATSLMTVETILVVFVFN
ncbi:hypothetical protein CCANI_01055 [Corynebacterium canis]|nr:hypothetical protein CCANI_01055 [Corynebacterium canis]